MLVEAGFQVNAFSRKVVRTPQSGIKWNRLPFSPAAVTNTPANIRDWICIAPIWVLPDYLPMLQEFGVRRLIALSSTSRFTKENSSVQEEQSVAQLLSSAESHVQAWAASQGVEWVILRPTLIYGLGSDKNISEIVKIIRKFGIFPILGKARGMRQPIHVADLAFACLASLTSPLTSNRAYNLSGGETLTYREMVKRVFASLGRPAILLPVPLPLFKIAISILRRIPKYRNWTSAMAERMNSDLMFDHRDASRDFGFAPRQFVLDRNDIPK
ncbi:NAD-dependent epimerase/dehydratase family protein [Pseudomonas sp. QD4]|uniref:NAD-dependent epimerase/dehydratase family protein n=1 Tax=Pseudomonas sp. QD4 TaxID=3368618 RepID=UPI003BA16077